MFVSLDDGKTYVKASNPVRVVYGGVAVPAEEAGGEVHICLTDEGVIMAVWVHDEDSAHHIAPSANANCAAGIGSLWSIAVGNMRGGGNAGSVSGLVVLAGFFGSGARLVTMSTA